MILIFGLLFLSVSIPLLIVARNYRIAYIFRKRVQPLDYCKFYIEENKVLGIVIGKNDKSLTVVHYSKGHREILEIEVNHVFPPE